MHNINHTAYPYKVNKADVQADWDEVVRHADWQEGASGLPGRIQWKDMTPFKDYNAAYDYIGRIDRDYLQVAVPFYQPKNVKYSKKYEDIQARYQEALKKYRELNAKFHFEGIKSELVGCKKCNSKISVKYLNRNVCPVCGADMRPQSTLDRIESLRQSSEKYAKQLAAEGAKCESKAKQEVMWLVKTEYHT